ncbi:MAG TPA: glycosyltransferase [Longimicrobium sp.]|nr:glycosyltransferase [Longimicrobium sp.]
MSASAAPERSAAPGHPAPAGAAGAMREGDGAADGRVEVLYVVNKTLPVTDYRLAFGRLSRVARVTYGLPDSVPGLSADRYLRVDLREGAGPRDGLPLLRLLAYLRRNRRRLALVHFFSTKLVLFGPLLASLAGVRSLVTVTGLGRTFSAPGPAYAALRRVYLFLVEGALRRSEAFLFQNRGDLAWMAARFPRHAAKMSYIGSAVSVPATGERDYDASPLGVLLVTRLFSAKGVDDFIEVARRLRGGRFRFVLVGPPSTGEDALLERVRAAHAAGDIEYRGEVTGPALYDEYRRAAVFYFPSRYAEGLARVMLEAGFFGLCPVACDIVSNRDLLAEGRGFVVPARDPEAAAALLRRLDGDRGLLRANALAYQTFIRGAYTEEAYTRRMDDLLRSVLPAAGG